MSKDTADCLLFQVSSVQCFFFFFYYVCLLWKCSPTSVDLLMFLLPFFVMVVKWALSPWSYLPKKPLKYISTVSDGEYRYNGVKYCETDIVMPPPPFFLHCSACSWPAAVAQQHVHAAVTAAPRSNNPREPESCTLSTSCWSPSSVSSWCPQLWSSSWKRMWVHKLHTVICHSSKLCTHMYTLHMSESNALYVMFSNLPKHFLIDLRFWLTPVR